MEKSACIESSYTTIGMQRGEGRRGGAPAQGIQLTCLYEMDTQ